MLGEAHAEVALDRLSGRHGVNVETRELVVPLRETFAGAGKGHGRHVKQSGGHGQYAVCDIEVEPLPDGRRLRVRRQGRGRRRTPPVHPAASRRACSPRWSAACAHGHPMVDLRVTLVDGKSHSVDSSDMAFQSAGALALREAAESAGVTLLEPYDEITVLVPDDQVGEVMGDISARRGRLLGTDKVGDDRTLVRAAGAADRAASATRSTCAPRPTGRARSPGRSRTTSRCRRTWPGSRHRG